MAIITIISGHIRQDGKQPIIRAIEDEEEDGDVVEVAAPAAVHQ